MLPRRWQTGNSADGGSPRLRVPTLIHAAHPVLPARTNGAVSHFGMACTTTCPRSDENHLASSPDTRLNDITTRKTADRLLLEMADKLPESLGTDAAALPARSQAEGEAHGALLALGYKPGEVVRMLKDLDGVRLSTEEMIREALKRVHRERVAER